MSTPEGSALPSAALLDRLLSRLDAFVSAPGTLAIHDPLYALRTEPDAAHLAVLSSALSAHPAHPLAGELQLALAPWLVEEPATLAGVLVEDGPIPVGADLLTEVRRRLLRAREVRRVLEARIATMERHGRLLNSTANGMAAVAAFLAVFALMGWLAALGAWEIPWLEAPELPKPELPAEPVSTEGG